MVLQSRPSTANKCPTSSAACHTQGGNTSQATRTRHLHRSGGRIHACMALRPPRRPRSWQHHLRMMQLMAPSIAGASVGPPPTCSTCRAAPIALKYLGCTLRRRTAARARPSCKLQACTCASGTIGRASQVRSCAVCEWGSCAGACSRAMSLGNGRAPRSDPITAHGTVAPAEFGRRRVVRRRRSVFASCTARASRTVLGAWNCH